MILHHKIYGTGDKNLLILHGLFGMLDNWHNIAGKASEKGFRVILADLRNHGQSPHQAEMNYKVMADDIDHLLEHLEIDQSHLIGHSMGGKVAMRFALDYPDKVEKLIVVDIAPKKYERGHDDIIDALYSLDPSSIEKRSEAEKHMAEKVPDAGTRLFLLKNLGRAENGNFEWKMNLDVIANSYDNIREEISSDNSFDKPTLFLSGGNSRYIKEEDKGAIKKLFPAASFESIEGAGHWVHAEKPEEFLVSILNFLS